MGLGVVLNGCGTWKAIAQDWENKPFIPGTYYAGDNNEKVQYDTLDGYKLAADTAKQQPYRVPCLDVNPLKYQEQSKSEGSSELGWFFKNSADGAPIGFNQIRYSSSWKKNSFLFEFNAGDGLVEVLSPFSSTRVQEGDYFPDEDTYNKIESRPADFYASSSYPGGYSIELVSSGLYWKDQIKEQSISGCRVKVLYEHLSKFWCCYTKTEPDSQLPNEPRVALFRPNAAALDNCAYEMGTLVGSSGTTGRVYGQSESYGQVRTFVRVTLWRQEVRTGQKTGFNNEWKQLTFEEFWNGVNPEVPEDQADKPSEVEMTAHIPGDMLKKWYNEVRAEGKITTRVNIELDNSNATNVNLLVPANTIEAGYRATIAGKECLFLITGNSTSITLLDCSDPPLVLNGATESARSETASSIFKKAVFTLDPELDFFLHYDGAKVTKITLEAEPAGPTVATVEVGGVPYGESLMGV